MTLFFPAPCARATRSSNNFHSVFYKLSSDELTYTIIYTEYNEEWNVFSAFNPSKWSSGQPTLRCSVPCSRVSPQSWTLPARAGIRTDNLKLPWVSSPTLYPLGHDCPALRCHYGGVEEDASNNLRRIKAVLDNNGAPTKYWHLGHSFDLFT